MMNNEDRKKVFWLIKKYSSYTVWKNWGDALQAFTDAWEYAVKKADDQDEFITEALKDLWDGCESFDKGIPLLKQGDRYIFRSAANWRIFATLDYADRIMNERDYVHEWMVNEKDVKRLYKQLEDLTYGPGWVTEQDEGGSAPLKPDTVFSTHTWPPKVDYAQFNFPPELGDVPDPTTTTVDTGKEVPMDGIWEPEWPDPTAKKGVVVNIRSLFTPSIPGNVQKGCMNYLIAGTIAPPYQDGSKQPEMSVRWRLIWQDSRYKDGSIPDEEKDYLRINAPSAAEPVTTERLSCKAGQPCPREGYWFTPARQASRRRFLQGEDMPEVGGSYGATIWQWDDQQ